MGRLGRGRRGKTLRCRAQLRGGLTPDDTAGLTQVLAYLDALTVRESLETVPRVEPNVLAATALRSAEVR